MVGTNYFQLLEPQIIEGNIFTDNRGAIEFVNDFRLDEFKRFYIIHHKNIATIRAWQAHKIEQKVFYALQGYFSIYLIKIDNWKTPDKNILPLKFTLSANSTKVLIVPNGYANGFINTVKNSKLLVFSSSTLEDSKSDDYRYDKNYFSNCNCNNYE